MHAFADTTRSTVYPLLAALTLHMLHQTAQFFKADTTLIIWALEAAEMELCAPPMLHVRRPTKVETSPMVLQDVFFPLEAADSQLVELSRIAGRLARTGFKVD